MKDVINKKCQKENIHLKEHQLPSYDDIDFSNAYKIVDKEKDLKEIDLKDAH